MGSPQYDVVHLGSRTHYQVSRGLNEAGLLSRLLTDLYTPDWVMRAAPRLPGRVREAVGRRSCPQLPSKKVELAGLSRTIPNLLHGRKGAQSYVEGLDRSFGRAAARRSDSAGVGAVVYSYYWLGFVDGRRSPESGPRIVFMEHPTPSQVSLLLAYHRRSAPATLPLDPEETISLTSIAEFESSLELADGIVVPCSFARTGLEELGIAPERIAVVPFGCDRMGLVSTSSGFPAAPSPRARLKLLWVGQPLFRKGFRDLIRAYNDLPPGLADLTLVFPTAAAAERAGDLAKIPEKAVVRTRISVAELHGVFASHDLFVMPSILEGFGMVYLEAMAMGTPVVCTPHTGAADLITDGKDGFVVEAGEPRQLTELLLRVADDRAALLEMREAAAQIGRTWTWDRFRQELAGAVVRLTGT